MANVRNFYTVDRHNIRLATDADSAARFYIERHFGLSAKYQKLTEGEWEVTRKDGTKKIVTVERTKPY